MVAAISITKPQINKIVAWRGDILSPLQREAAVLQMHIWNIHETEEHSCKAVDRVSVQELIAAVWQVTHPELIQELCSLLLYV